MKKKLGSWIMVVCLVLSLAFVSCDAADPKSSITTFFASSNNVPARSISRNVGSGDNIQFYVSALGLAMDNQPYCGWLIGGAGDAKDKAGWYDIDSLNRAPVYMGNKHNGPHSLVYLEIKGIKINNSIYEEFTIEGNDAVFPSISIVAGDTSKSDENYHFQINEFTKLLPDSFDGVDDLYNNVSQFIVVVDESKLHENDVLKDNWWECFSFIAR